MQVVFHFHIRQVGSYTTQERRAYDVTDLKEAVQIIQSLYVKPEYGHMAGFRYDGGTKTGSVNTNELLYVETIDDD